MKKITETTIFGNKRLKFWLGDAIIHLLSSSIKERKGQHLNTCALFEVSRLVNVNPALL